MCVIPIVQQDILYKKSIMTKLVLTMAQWTQTHILTVIRSLKNYLIRCSFMKKKSNYWYMTKKDKQLIDENVDTSNDDALLNDTRLEALIDIF